jgi:transcriptional regulator with XRE-family HTH domain
VSQNELARRLQTNQGHISKIEQGDLRVDMAQVLAICRAIGVPFMDLMQAFITTVCTENEATPQ